METVSGPDEEEVGIKPKVRNAVELSASEEVREQSIDHGSFRGWCPHCVKGMGVTYGHFQVKEYEEGRVPVVSIDDMYMHERQEREEEKGMPILVVKYSESKIWCGHVVLPTRERQVRNSATEDRF